MNRYALISTILIVVIAIVGGIFLFSSLLSSPSEQPGVTPGSLPDSRPPLSPQQGGQTGSQSGPQSKEAVQAAFRNEIAPYDDDNTKLYETVISGGYALQVWIGDNKGGEALLKYDTKENQWVVLTGGGGAWSVDGLVQAGVPRETAVALLSEIPR